MFLSTVCFFYQIRIAAKNVGIESDVQPQYMANFLDNILNDLALGEEKGKSKDHLFLKFMQQFFFKAKQITYWANNFIIPDLNSNWSPAR